MSQQLIPTFSGEIDGEIQQLVNGRDLHAYVSRDTKYQDWISRKIEQYGFTQGIDYLDILKKTNGDNWFGGSRKITEHHLTLDMAKELAMLESNEQGRKARRYFIEMEKLARQEIPAYLRRGDLPRPGQVEALQLSRLKEELLAARPEWKALERYHRMGLSTIEMGRLVGKTGDAVRHHLVRMNAAGIIAYAPKSQYVEAGRKGRAALTLMKTGAA